MGSRTETQENERKIIINEIIINNIASLVLRHPERVWWDIYKIYSLFSFKQIKIYRLFSFKQIKITPKLFKKNENKKPRFYFKLNLRVLIHTKIIKNFRCILW